MQRLLIVKSILEREVYFYVPGRQREWRNILSGAPTRAELSKGETVKNWINDRRGEFLQSQGLGNREVKKGWFNFGFPLHYNSDVLESLYALAMADVLQSSNLEKALALIRQKGNKAMQWKLENSLNGKMWVDVEEKGKPRKWITYRALFVLRHFLNPENPSIIGKSAVLWPK